MIVRMQDLGNIGLLGSGSWATALAHLLLGNCDRIGWFMRRPERIEEFRRCRHNPVYLSDITFDTDRVDFSSDINEVCRRSDTLVVALPSPYLLAHIEEISVDLSAKNIVSAVKGIVPTHNMIVTEYFKKQYGCDDSRMLVIGGPCHAEEVALERLSYLTIGCHDRAKAVAFASSVSGKRLKTIISHDVEGIEYAAVLKNVYAIAAGIVYGMNAGDNFLAMMMSNALREMKRFIDTVSPMERNICDSAYLGDLLVTSYSRFSRNHNFGAMIGRGYSVRTAKMEMKQVAEGYYGTRCIYDINRELGVDMPIMDCVYDVLYRDVRPRQAIDSIIDSFV